MLICVHFLFGNNLGSTLDFRTNLTPTLVRCHPLSYLDVLYITIYRGVTFIFEISPKTFLNSYIFHVIFVETGRQIRMKVNGFVTPFLSGNRINLHRKEFPHTSEEIYAAELIVSGDFLNL